ncbi:hypothetical protein TNIN_371391 [Trichonephila inaurata madagascariensis]|uniref:Uncharacterized protein n=1 Tax=Trichonephila inaurata madagascariensis TaxID=2747483 RepID=A0A8X6XHS5_9ARAC|nr:hypothetical protein TNIN_371391 [Trichonephila inaurata madagascariensis]
MQNKKEMTAVFIFSVCLIVQVLETRTKFVPSYPRPTKKLYALSSLALPFPRPSSAALSVEKRSRKEERRRFSRNCPDGYVYDFYFVKCRMIVCALPGYVINGKKCVKEN